ncbi:uncharacterized protein LOC112989987 [Dromaius novaehollandiae]|uniref:uncharacterized protein LOC112989987 n=1 Tax=Dromaius novaehollandiae TaxID=8790 RepID=UPI00311DD90B
MGQTKSKSSGPMRRAKKEISPIPSDSPLGIMLKEWDDYPPRQKKDKSKMVYYCTKVWGGQQIRPDKLIWPVYGSSEDWICQALNLWVNDKEPWNPEESEYAELWLSPKTGGLFPLKEKKGGKEKNEQGRDKVEGVEEEEPCLSPPPYVPPPPPPTPAMPRAIPDSDHPLPSTPQLAEDSDTGSDSSQGPRRSLRRRTRRQDENFMYPLREIALGGPQPQMGFVSIPLNSENVRSFKKEMGALLEDPLGVAEKVDQFLGPNTYTWEEMQAILGILFTTEEREMIRRAGMRIWDQQHQQGPRADTKWPLQRPNWDNQNEQHRTHMQDMRIIMIQGIRESVPRGQNISKAFSEFQKKDETPTEWLERLRKSFQLYSGVDPETPAGQVLLKTQFVTKSWTDIRKKLEKIEDWQARGLDELLREAQKVYVRREEESQKKQARMLEKVGERQARMLVVALKEGQTRKDGDGRPQRRALPRVPQPGGENPQRDRREMICFYCGGKGHMRRECRKRIADEKMFQED